LNYTALLSEWLVNNREGRLRALVTSITAQELPDKIDMVTIMEVWSEKLSLQYEVLFKNSSGRHA
jgi:hypothetical protein